MSENARDFLSMLCFRYFIWLINYNDWIHTLIVYQDLNKTSPCATNICKAVTNQGRRIGVPTNCQQGQWTRHTIFICQTFCQSFRKCCFTNARISLKTQHMSTCIIIICINPLTNYTLDLLFCLFMPINCLIQY